MEQLIKVPDIGGSSNVDVIEILVKVGDHIHVDTPIVTLESDKASMEIPSSHGGIVKSIQVKVGDKVSQNDVLLTLEVASTAEQTIEAPPPPSQTSNQLKEVLIPDIGGSSNVDVIEIFVKIGDTIKIDSPLVTLESDKASMEIPSTDEGIVRKIHVKIGDKVSKGSPLLQIETAKAKTETVVVESKKEEKIEAPKPQTPVIHDTLVSSSDATMVLAGPSVRRLVRALGVNLADVKGSGRKSRVTQEDVEAYVKQRLQQPTTSGNMAFSLPQSPSIDFSQFGPIETKPLSKIKKISGQNLHRAWLQIPHVTQFDEADITELEQFRKTQTSLVEKEGIKLTPLAFITKVVCRALQELPDFNSSLSSDGQELILKNYINIGIAVDTPQGLVVPVIKNVQDLSIKEIAQKMSELSQKARQKALLPTDMSGGTFTISSLGGIGGTAFTPIVNHPEVAILGVSKSSIKPIYENNQFIPRLMLPLSLSYDHRVIDGAQGARFIRYLSELLSDIRKVML
jgi:pyruvate dehydrogenase E2 component (dihydrolipoamide acetyltransferase)